MTFCAIKTCPNSKMIQFKKRAKMCCFPKRDPKRCLVWIEYVKKEMKISNWTPTKNSALCEDHFSSNMWEPRTDLKKLKGNAIPDTRITDQQKFLPNSVIDDKEGESFGIVEKNVNILTKGIPVAYDIININEIGADDSIESLDPKEVAVDLDKNLTLIRDLNLPINPNMTDQQMLKELLKSFDESEAVKAETEKNLKIVKKAVWNLQEKVQQIENFQKNIKLFLVAKYGENILEAI